MRYQFKKLKTTESTQSPEDMNKWAVKISPAAKDLVSKGEFIENRRGPTKNNMNMDDNVLADIISHIAPTSAANIQKHC